MAISVLLVDDHAIFREGVAAFLNSTSECSIVGESGDGFDALVKAEYLHPDVVVLDCVMPHLNGTELVLWIRNQRPATKVVMLSMHSEMTYVYRSIRNGASGYILKEDVVSHLSQAINVAATGKFYYFSPSIKKMMNYSEIGHFDDKGEVPISL